MDFGCIFGEKVKTTILIATHKETEMPLKENYVPILVGSIFHNKAPKGYLTDDSGRNISSKNPHFNELTALYWARYNLESDIIGLVQYRRYFISNVHKKSNGFDDLLSKSEIIDLLSQSDVIVAKQRHYYIETIESHYRHTHNGIALDEVKEIISSGYPTYAKSMNNVLNSRHAHMFNMFIMSRKDIVAYCNWLFPILLELEDRLDYTQLEGNESRAVGFISEILLDVWLQANNFKVKEENVRFLGDQHFFKKVFIFLLNKLTGSRRILGTHIK